MAIYEGVRTEHKDEMADLLKNSLDAAYKAGQQDNPFLHRQTRGLFPGDKLFWDLVNCARQNRDLSRQDRKHALLCFAWGYLSSLWKEGEHYD